MDGKVLYTSIPNHVGIDAVKETLNNGAKKAIATRIIVDFFYLILILKNFVLNDIINYFQIKDCPKGTICALAYANIFMGNLKSKLLKIWLLFYRQYVFLMEWYWIRTNQIYRQSHQKHATIKLESTFSRTSILFLDTYVYKDENGTLCSTTYRKPSDLCNLYYKSAYPKALKLQK